MKPKQKDQQPQPMPAAGAVTDTVEKDQQDDPLLARLLEKGFRARTEEDRSRARDTLDEFIKRVTEGVVHEDREMLDTVDELIADIDRKLSDQMNEIIHQAEFMRVEGSWRGLHHLIHESNTGPELEVRMLNVSRKDLHRDLTRAPEFDQSGLFKKIYEEEFGTPGGKPFSYFIGDYEFSNHPQDIQLLEKISNVAAAGWVPFFAAAAPQMLDLDSFQDLANPRDLSMIFEDDAYIKWRMFRESEDSRFVGLCLPRTLMRLPYGEDTCPVDSFAFEEDVSNQGSHSRYVWGNAAFSLGTRINDAFDQYGWCTAIRGLEGGGAVQGLPLHTFRSDTGETVVKCPTEIAITDRRSNELEKLGFIPLCHYKKSDYAVFFSVRSVQKPKQYDLPEAQANADLSSQMQYLLATSRFAHYIKVIQRDKLGSHLTAENVAKFLNDWIAQYVLLNDKAGQELKARQPLREARIEVTEIPGRPGCYDAIIWLKPHYQLEELNVSLRLVATLDTPKRES